ncbi:hypothetical protein HGO34_14410 [Agrobacterium vitis]|uniref:Uncharacterized protein n=1 Tax=Agrobacterium vitis TaxID=373 RepID=A0AAE4WDU1_AGRVI|nr:hypothetical protein [Allorhizobium sp. Av2]MCM2440909.1 hypothetical protein [Agrobacterium vitis]MUZ59112.1 hypothetical protein [Agrobacterium vitis]MVA66761.1 hypothetical protein [Agrobacterium vitis]MVA87204.1 hypothetical protein [Agrobacterium vitis]
MGLTFWILPFVAHTAAPVATRASRGKTETEPCDNILFLNTILRELGARISVWHPFEEAINDEKNVPSFLPPLTFMGVNRYSMVTAMDSAGHDAEPLP